MNPLKKKKGTLKIQSGQRSAAGRPEGQRQEVLEDNVLRKRLLVADQGGETLHLSPEEEKTIKNTFKVQTLPRFF